MCYSRAACLWACFYWLLLFVLGVATFCWGGRPGCVGALPFYGPKRKETGRGGTQQHISSRLCHGWGWWVHNPYSSVKDKLITECSMRKLTTKRIIVQLLHCSATHPHTYTVTFRELCCLKILLASMKILPYFITYSCSHIISMSWNYEKT
jgi:hypothetical protein